MDRQRTRDKIPKGEGEYKYCDRCGKRFRRKKSIWNLWRDSRWILCPKCEDSLERWFEMKNE